MMAPARVQFAGLVDGEVEAFRREPDQWERKRREKHDELIRSCNATCQALCDVVSKDVLKVKKSQPTLEAGASKSTVGLMLDGCKIDNMLIGGPAHNSGELDKGDLIIAVDDVPVTPDTVHQRLLGKDVPGSFVGLTVQKPASGNVQSVNLVRMPAAEIADKRRLFELFTALKTKAKNAAHGQQGGSEQKLGIDTSKGFGQLVDESIALWSKMIFEEAWQKHQIVLNAKDIQEEGMEIVGTLQGNLDKLLESMKAVFAVMEDARREHSISRDKYQIYETTIAELRAQLTSKISELQRCCEGKDKLFAELAKTRGEHSIIADKYQIYETMIEELRSQLASKKLELQRCYEDKDELFADLAKTRGKLDLIMNSQGEGAGDSSLIQQLREQRDKAVSEAETLKGRLGEAMRLLEDGKDALLRAQTAEQQARCTTDQVGGQIILLREETVKAVSEMRKAKMERAEAVATVDRQKGELLVLKEQIAEEEKERIRQGAYFETNRGDLDRARGEALQLREVNEELRTWNASLSSSLREAKAEPTKLQGQIDELKKMLDWTREQLVKTQGEVEAQRRERDHFNGQLIEINSRIAMHVKQAEEKSAERDAAKSEAAEYSILLERAKVFEVSARDEIRNQTKATKIAEAAAEQLRRDLAKTNAEVEEMNKLKGQLQQLRDDLERKGEEIKILTNEKAACIKESQECQGQKAIDGHLKEAQELAEARDSALAAHANVQGELQGITELNDHLQASFKEKEDKLSNTEVALAKIRGEKDEFKTLVQLMREKDTAREEKIKEFERQKEDSITSVSQLEGRVEAYRLRIEQLESDISDEQVQKQCARKEAVMLSTQLEEMKKDVDDVHRRLKESEANRDRAQESEERISTQLTAEKARIAALEQAAGALESVVAKSKTDKDQAVADLLKSNAQERISCASVKKLQDELKAAEDKVTAQRGLLATAEQDLLAVQRSLQECQDTVSTKERSIRALRDELALTTTLVQDKEKQIATLMQELEEEQSTRLRQSASSSFTINKTEEERDKIKREHALCVTEITSLKTHIAELRDKLHAERAVRGEVEVARDTVSREHAHCAEKFAEQQREIATLKQRIKELQELTSGRQFCGVGLAVEEQKRQDGSTWMRINSLVPDGGALETGLINVGDEIVSIDGVEPSSSQHVMALARGLAGSESTFVVKPQHQGSMITVVVKRKLFDHKSKVGVALAAFLGARSRSEVQTDSPRTGGSAPAGFSAAMFPPPSQMGEDLPANLLPFDFLLRTGESTGGKRGSLSGIKAMEGGRDGSGNFSKSMGALLLSAAKNARQTSPGRTAS